MRSVRKRIPPYHGREYRRPSGGCAQGAYHGFEYLKVSESIFYYTVGKTNNLHFDTIIPYLEIIGKILIPIFVIIKGVEGLTKSRQIKQL